VDAAEVWIRAWCALSLGMRKLWHGGQRGAVRRLGSNCRRAIAGRYSLSAQHPW